MRRFRSVSAQRLIVAFLLGVCLAASTSVAAESPQRASLIERGIISDGGRRLVQLDSDEVTDADWVALTNDDLLKLREVAFNCGVSDVGLARLSDAPQLQSLAVVSAGLVEGSFQQIGKMKNLKELAIILVDRGDHHSSLMTADVAEIGALKQLETLALQSERLLRFSLFKQARCGKS